MQEKNVDTWASNSLSVKVKDVVGVHLKMEAKHLGVSSQLRKVNLKNRDFIIYFFFYILKVVFIALRKNEF